jgi:hypothetical protein
MVEGTLNAVMAQHTMGSSPLLHFRWWESEPVHSNDTSTNMSGYKSGYKSDYTTDVKSLADDDPNAVDGETNEKTDMITGLFITGTLWIAAHTCSEQGNTIDVLDLRKD